MRARTIHALHVIHVEDYATTQGHATLYKRSHAMQHYEGLEGVGVRPVHRPEATCYSRHVRHTWLRAARAADPRRGSTSNGSARLLGSGIVRHTWLSATKVADPRRGPTWNRSVGLTARSTRGASATPGLAQPGWRTPVEARPRVGPREPFEWGWGSRHVRQARLSAAKEAGTRRPARTTPCMRRLEDIGERREHELVCCVVDPVGLAGPSNQGRDTAALYE